MEFVAVLAAAVASYVFGAVWYGVFSKAWMAAAGLTMDMIKSPGGAQSGSAKPYIITFLCSVLIAGMMRHVFEGAEVDTLMKAGLNGFGIGAFLATPWIVTNYTFGMRPASLSLIDGGYATIGCTIMGLVLGLFGVGIGA
jgi:hypothetical protein